MGFNCTLNSKTQSARWKILRKEYLDTSNNELRKQLNKKDQGKEITLYAFLNLKKNWHKILNDIEKILIKYNIKPNKYNGNTTVTACKPVKGSKYLSYRCDYFFGFDGQKRYVKANNAAYKAGEIKCQKSNENLLLNRKKIENDEKNAYNPNRVVDPFAQLEIISNMHYGLKQSLFAVQPSNTNQQINSTPFDCKIICLKNL